MLVLTRKAAEQIFIGDNITISILKLKGNTVRIGIEAPRDVRVLRGELPTFDGTLDVEVSDGGSAEPAASEGTSSRPGTSNSAGAAGDSEASDADAVASQREWEVLQKVAGRRKACLPVRRCAPNAAGAAPLAALVRGTSLAAASASTSE